MVIKKEILEQFSAHLKNVRKEKFNTSKGAARALEIPYTTYNNYERAISLPTVYEIIKFIRVFEIDLKYLFKPFLTKEKDEELVILQEYLKKIRKYPEYWDDVSGLIKIINKAIHIIEKGS